MVERRGTKALELWCRRITDGYPGVNVQNMTTSWRDGLAFCAMIHHFRPDLVDFNSLNKDDIYGNNELAFRIAEQQLGIPALLDAADMASCSVPDRLSILTYLSQFYQTFGGSSPSRLALKRTKEEPDARLASVSGSPQPKVAIRSGVRKEPCVVCGLPVFLAEKLVIERSLYHRTCFRCARCNHQLTIGNYYETEEGQYCCETCPDEEVPSPSVMHQEYNQNVLFDKTIHSDENFADEYSTGYQRALSDEEKTSKHRTLADVQDETPSRTSRMRLNFIASHLLSEKNPADDETSWNESKPFNPQISPVVLTDDACSSSPSSSLAVSCETLPIESQSGAASDLNEEESAVNSLENKSINSFSASQHATAIASHDIDYEGRKFKEDTKDADRTGGSEAQPLSLVQQRRKLFENNFQTDKKAYKANEPNSVVVNISQAKPEVVERKPDDVGERCMEVATPSEKIGESQSLGTETSDVIEKSFSAVDVKEEPRGAVQELPSAVEAKAPSGGSVTVEESHRTGQVEERHSGVEVEESSGAVRVEEKDLEVEVDEPSKPAKGEEPVTAVDAELIVETSGDQSVCSPMEKSLTNISGIDLSDSNENYPEDLNPFRSDDESDEENKASRSESKPLKAASTNPFDSSDEEDQPPGVVPPRPAARKSKSPAHPSAQSTKRRLKAPDINLNPFWSDDESVSDDDKIKKIEPKSLPIPKPRNIKPSPEPSPVPRKVSLERGGVNASNTSLASTGSTVTPGGTFRKKKPAPKPPAAEDAAGIDTSTIKSPEPAHRFYEQKDSPAQATPRVRKSKPAPPPPMFTSTPINAEECEPDKIKEPSSLVWEEQKSNKDEANRTRQSLSAATGIEDSAHHYSSPFIDKSSQGKWKRKKGPAPPRPMPHRRKIKVMSTKDVKMELDEIEMQQQGLEKQGVRLEQLIRDKCETGEELEEMNHRIDVEELVLELFALVNEKNELFRRQAELTLLRRQQRFEEEHADVEYQIRCLMSQPEATKTDSDKQREEMLIQRLVEIVERRNEIVECLEMDRRREVEEDRSIHKQMGLFAAKSKGDLTVDVEDDHMTTPTSKKEKSKEKLKDRLSKKGCNKKDADKDVDESEMKLKRHKRKWF